MHRVKESSASVIHRGGSAVRQGLGDGLPSPTIGAVHIGASSQFLPQAEKPHEVRLAMTMLPSVPIGSISNHSALILGMNQLSDSLKAVLHTCMMYHKDARMRL